MKAREIYIDLVMQMQENSGCIREMDQNQYETTLKNLNVEFSQLGNENLVSLAKTNWSVEFK